MEQFFYKNVLKNNVLSTDLEKYLTKVNKALKRKKLHPIKFVYTVDPNDRSISFKMTLECLEDIKELTSK